MLALVLFGGVASGSPVDYLDAQFQVDQQLEVLYVRYTVSSVLAGEQIAPVLADAQHQAHAVLNAAHTLEEWPGDDKGLNEALIQRAQHSVLYFDQTLPTMVSLITASQPRDADQLQYETLLNLSEVTDAQDVERLNRAILSFAKANRVRVDEEPPAPLKLPTLELDLPGRASDLPDEVRVTFAIGHHNEMIERHDQVLSAWNDLTLLESAKIAEQRPVVELAVQELKQVPPWMGDDTLTSALTADGEGLLELVDLMVQSAELDMRVFLFGKKKRQRDSLLRQVDSALPSLNANAQQAVASFLDAWQISAYERHIEELHQWARSQKAGL